MALVSMPGYRWPVDPDVKGYGHRDFRCPPHHVRQCQGESHQYPGEQCRFWAMKGSKYCVVHGSARNRSRNRMNMYEAAAGSKLKESLEKIRKKQAEAYELVDELELARVITLRYVTMYDKVVMEGKNDKGEDVSPELKDKVIRQLKDSLNQVASLVERAAKSQALAAQFFTPQMNMALLEKVSKAIASVIGDETETYAKIIEAIGKISVSEAKSSPKVSIAI